MGQRPDKVELLAPAGSREALIGALNAGADAVYLGGERFGARAYADNFSDEEILRAIEEAHVLGRKIYLTANILTREDELAQLTAFVEKLWRGGLDGAIVQDLGVLQALGQACPGLPLHASTQMSVTSSESVRYLRRLGVTRVVPARELSLAEVSALRQEDQDQNGQAIEIESFIHGAMCYSYSGRCLMSSFLGGRSGNRGRCAGTCRLPARILDEKGRPAGPDARSKDYYPLSMKDMCVLPILPDLIDAGITSFKIEGRMKKPVYAAGVTAIYRKYIDRCYAWMEAGRPGPWKVEEKDLQMLRALYIRTSLGTGYYRQRNGRSLVTVKKPGYAGTDPVLEEEIRKQYLGGLSRLEISGKAVFRIGRPAELMVSPVLPCKDGLIEGKPGKPGDGPAEARIPGLRGNGQAEAVCARAEGPLVQKAQGRPLKKADLEARLRKTGESLFTFSSLEVESDEDIFLPVSAVNALRREALDRLRDRLASGKEEKEEKEENGRDSSGILGGPTDLPQGGAKGGGADPGRTVPDTADLCGPETGQTDPEEAIAISGGPRPRQVGREVWAMVSQPRQLEAAVSAACPCILIDGDFDEKLFQNTQIGNKSAIKSQGIQFIRVLPPVFRVCEREKISSMIKSAWADGFSGIMVRTLEELELARQMQYDGQIIAGSSLYTWNSMAMRQIASDCHRIVCSLELNQAGIREAALAAAVPHKAGEAGEGDRHSAEAFFGRLILPVYGRVPMMETAGCVRKTENLCSKREGFWQLEDRMGKRLPVRCRCRTCSNTIYNAVPLSLHQFAGQGLMKEVPVHLCMFTTETPGQTQKILEYFSALPEDRSGRARGKILPPPFAEFTNGHFKTGAT